MAQSTVNLIRGLYEAFARGDVPTVLASLDPQVDWNETEGFPYGGKYVGPDAVLNGVFMRLGTEWEGYSAVPDELLDAGDRVVALGWYSGTYKGTGKSFRARFAHVWTVRDGKIVHFQQYADTAEVNRALSAASGVAPEAPGPEVTADEVTEASWESFPASDAPAWRQHE